MKKIFFDKKFLLWLYIIVAIGIAAQLIIEQHTINSTSFNNFKIFKNAFGLLISHQNLYIEHPQFYFDLYKYSPSFAALMLPFYYLPDWLGISVWNLLNTLVLFFAVYSLQQIDAKKRALILLFVLLEMITSIQNSQSNTLIAGLLIFAFSLFEKEKIFWAALCIVLSFYIKIFGAAVFVLFLFYPNKLKFIFYSAFWTILIFLMPLFFVSMKDLAWQYQNWLMLLINDQQASYGNSMMGLIHAWLHIDVNKTLTMLVGLLLLIVPFIKTMKENIFQNRIAAFCLILLWMIIFNHRSESPTFIIASAAVALWYFSKTEKSVLNLVLLFVVLVFTSVITTDIIPLPNKRYWLMDMALKVLPCVLVWLKILFDFYLNKKERFR